MSAPPDSKFQDHYKVLGIEQEADSDTISQAYTKLAARYNPSAETADPALFAAVNYAYEVLADPAARATFDGLRSGPEKEGEFLFTGRPFFNTLSGELARRQSILCILYDRRRQRPSRPSLSLRQIENMLTASSDDIQFSIWYLRQKGWVASDDKSNLQISVNGMDYLEKNLEPADSLLALIKATSLAEAPSAPELEVPAEPEHAVETKSRSARLFSRKIVIPPKASESGS